MKLARQRAIASLVETEPLGSQAQIAKRLRAKGFRVTQSTVSRDIEELGLARVRDAQGRMRYARPGEARIPRSAGRLRRLLQEFALDLEASANLVLVKTPPGAANAVAQALDQAGVEGVLGTVAGDDTIIVVAREGLRGRTLLARLRRLMREAAA